MKPITLHIVDRNRSNIEAIRRCFPDVNTMCADINQATGYDVLITPGNSFGIMDGGFDAVVKTLFGASIEEKIRTAIDDEFHGKLPVGCAVCCGNATGPDVIYAPTMRVPMQITRTDNVYLAMRAALLWISRYNDYETAGEHEPQYIENVMTPLLGAGAGKMPALQAATQMRLAWDSIYGDRRYKRPANLQEADAIQAAIGLGLGGDPDHF